MKRYLSMMLAVALVLPILAAPAQAGDFIEKGKEFIDSLKDDKVDAKVLKEIEARFAKLSKAEKLDPNTDFIGEALLDAYKPYRSAMKSWFRQYYAKAAKQLMKVSMNSDNDFLVAHTNYFLARTYLQTGQFEKAESILGELSQELDLFHRDYEVVFYHGLAAGQLLKRDTASKVFARFLKDFPKAPERYRILAKKIANELKVRGENELYDLADRMTLVQRLLSKQQSGKGTQKKEKEIITILDALIKKAEEKEKGSGT